MERAIAYCRVSDPRQIKEEGSLDRQALEAKVHAERNSYELVQTFIERGESAKTDDRTELHKLLAFARKEKIAVLIIPKIDRLARYSYDYMTLKSMLASYGTRIESVGERLEDSPAGRFMETMLAGAAQFDNEVRAERSRNGLIDAFKKGRWVWRAPYGYEHLDGNLVPKEPEAAIVRRIFAVASEMTPAQCFVVARSFGFERSKTRLYAILQNPVYAGRMRGFGMEVQGTYEPLVSETLLYRTKKQKRHERVNLDFTLKSMFKCCGPLTASWTRGRTRTYGYYRCRECGRSFERKRLEAAFVAYLNQWAMSVENLAHLERIMEETLKQRTGRRKVRQQQTRQRIEQNRELQRGLALKSASGVIPDDLAQEQITTLREEEAGLREQIVKGVEIVSGAAKFARKVLQFPGAFWLEAKPSDRLRFQQFIFPEGAQFNKKLVFGTKKIRLLEPARRLVLPDIFGLVDPSTELLNDFVVDLADFRSNCSQPLE